MKLKFWKRSNESKSAKASKGKRQRKSKDCTECENLRTIVEELQNYRDRVLQQQQELDALRDLLNTTKQNIAEIIAAHKEATEQSKREEQLQMERLRSSILQMKKEHGDEVQVLKTSKVKVENEFQEYKTVTEQSRKDEQKELEKLRAELAELKEQHQYERDQLRMQVSQATDPQSYSYAWVLSLRPQQPAFHLAQSDYTAPEVIQAPRRIGSLSYNPSTSAFHVYKKDHDVFMSQRSQQETSSSPITAEDEEVASILSNALPPGEYVRRHYGH